MASDMYNQSVFLVLKAAYSYYIQNQSQQEIARSLNISVTTVSRLLKKAKEQKIVEFVIRDPYEDCIRMGEGLKEKFHLKDVVVAPALSIDLREDDWEEHLKKLVALEGARYLQRIIKPGDVLGITWGGTIYHMINYLNPSHKVKADFITLHGSIANCDSELDVRTLVTRMAKAFSGVNYVLLTEALLSTKQAADIIKQEKNIRKIAQKFDEINISISGMGSFYPEVRSMLASSDFMTDEELRELQIQDVVGDIALRFFDSNGQECNSSMVDRMVAIDLEKFKKIETKISVVSGSYKAHTVKSALKGGLIDILIVDSDLAGEILRLGQED